MSSDQTSIRFPWVALALSFLASGVGHLYCGRIVKGLFLYIARFLLPLPCILAAFLEPSNGVLFGLILLPAAAMVFIYFYAPLSALAIAMQTGANYRLKEYNRSSIYGLLVITQLAYPVALTWGACEYVYEAFLIPSRSMSPNFLSGDRILVNKRPMRHYVPERGEVIVFRAPASEKSRVWIKRVIGVAGDRIVIRGSEIEVNGKKLERERVPPDALIALRNQVEEPVARESHSGRRYRVHFSDEPDENSNSTDGNVANVNAADVDVTVPARSFYVLGDHRDRSRDSRHIGFIHQGDVLGSVDYIFFPAETWSRMGVCRD